MEIFFSGFKSKNHENIIFTANPNLSDTNLIDPQENLIKTIKRNLNKHPALRKKPLANISGAH